MSDDKDAALQPTAADDSEDYWRPDDLWAPYERHGWTWVQTGRDTPEGYSLFDADGELMGHVYSRFNRVICWAPFTWAEEAYRSTDDIGEFGFEDEAQRRRHFDRIGPALTDWVRRKRAAGVDIARLRDTHAYYFETRNGHYPETVAEHDYGSRGILSAEEESALALAVDGWRAEPVTGCYCDVYRLRDEAGQMRGQLQVRLGIVRAVAAQPADANKVDPLRQPEHYYLDGRQTCRGQIVLRERLRPMAVRFEPSERNTWLRRAVAAVRGTPNPDRAYPPETLGAWGSPGQIAFPASPRGD